ncbi:uncharacterized protein LOC113051784 [Carassius auratus]|uniref:Uncharacterized protein LOC113051784 n=1 Tax=Carassius auratus TaxID=7957 RepID=A0A6P6KJ84_CARAU|nr:uncharacterized protein LOC113051784 [Carassius auratus]
MSQKAGDIILLLLLIMIYGMNPGEFNRGQAHLTWNNGEMEIRISFESRHNVTVCDKAKQLVCDSTNSSCYIECSSNELFENKTFIQKEQFTMNLTINDQNKTRVDFSIDNTTSSCILVDCLSDDIKDLLNVKAKKMKMPHDMRNILNIKRMCKDVVFSDPVVTTYIGVEKKAIQNIINMSIPEQSKSYNQEDLSITVVKMNLSKTEDFFSIAAPSVRLLPHIIYAKSPG